MCAKYIYIFVCVETMVQLKFQRTARTQFNILHLHIWQACLCILHSTEGAYLEVLAFKWNIINLY